MIRKVLRATAFLCLLAMMAVTLTGCADVFEKVINFIKTVVKTVKDVFGKVDKVVTTVKDAVKTGKNAVDKIKDIFKGGDKKTGTDKGKGGGKITNPEDDMDDAKGGGGTTSGGSSTGPGKGPGTGAGAGGSTEPPGSNTEKSKLSSELEKALTNLDGKIKQLEKLLKEDLPASTKEQIEETLERMKDLKEVLEGTKGDLKTADTQSELDRIKEDLEDSQKGFIKLVEVIQKIVSGIKKAGDTAISIINKIKTWTKILTGGTTDTKPGSGTGTSGGATTVAGLTEEIRATFGIEVKNGVTADVGWGFKTTAGSWDVKELTIVRDTLAKLPPHFVKCTTLIYNNQSVADDISACFGLYSPADGTMWMSDLAMQHGEFAGTLVHEMTHAYQRANPHLEKEWTKLFWNGKRPKTSSPTDYGNTNPSEDMAESVRLYFVDPAALKLDKARYEFVKKFIMGGKEF
ncbi:MAG: hypothetical protein OZSIB_0090 [Candidatus Ozemobacter sibiricus]|uniref:Uncharacterized protein n=1 Tax=Candidatus Ozemobacter sibiricus TaxID=2268124 RepID=A0A367ZN27_9BACT|nr:MAG: hypothetical protein OZSIB_0090 [Candidatus Ozemobacter sibiricus]